MNVAEANLAKNHWTIKLESLTEAQILKFWSNVHKTDGCWMWMGNKNELGYGISSINHRNFKAHRVSWFIHHHNLPERMCVLHRCDNPPCVNPAHLWIGTMKDNTDDMVRKGRSGPANHPETLRRGDNHYRHIHPELSFGERNPAHKLIEAQVIEIRKRYSSEGISQSALAREYGVHPHSVCLIVHRKAWKHLL